MVEYRVFKPGDRVRVLPHREVDWMKHYGEMEIATIWNNGEFWHETGAGHPQSCVMTNGQVFSCWWFDPNAPEMLEPTL